MISSAPPAEILDHIFSYLQNDPDTLKSIDDVCLETHSRFLRGILDRHLYAHIVVTNFISTRPGFFFYTQLFQYLTSNPHVSKYIRTLQIEIEMSSPFQWHDLSSILQMLQSTLKGIALSSRSSCLFSSEISEPMLEWSDLDETFRKAFLDCLRSSNLTEASINCIDGLPLSIFNDCTMQKISLRRVKVSSSPLPQFPLQTVSLRTCDLQSVISIRDWARGGPNLQSLDFRSDNEFSFSDFLGGLYAESLSDLCLDFGTLFMRLYPPPYIKLNMFLPLHIDISCLPNLTKLTIWACISLSIRESWTESAIPAIAQVAATSPSLQQLILRIRVDPRCVERVANSEIWEPLVPLAARPSLEHIELGVSQSSKGRHIPDIISTLLRVSQLKKMYEEGFLSLKEVDEWLPITHVPVYPLDHMASIDIWTIFDANT